MTQTSTLTMTSGLRSLAWTRAAFSVIWVALVVTTSAPLAPDDKPAAITAVLLVIYPLWDAVATLIARRLAGAGSTTRIGTVNIALGVAAAIAMAVAVVTTFGAALLVFGVWALLSGALQLTVAIQRRRTVGAQWPMVISGGLSVLAGVSIAAMSAAGGTRGLLVIAGYSAFGAFWFIVSAIALGMRGRQR